MGVMAEVRFYHLEHQTLDEVLPRMLQLTLERGGRAVVQTGSDERTEQLTDLLWTFDQESFLAHGSKADGEPGLQPIWLTAQDENPNGANVRFYVDGARAGSIDGLERAIVIFDGRDEAAVEAARQDWKRFKAGAHEVSYWQQDEQRRWQNRAAR